MRASENNLGITYSALPSAGGSTHQIIDERGIGKLCQFNDFSVLEFPYVKEIGRHRFILRDKSQFYPRVDRGTFAVDDDTDDIPLNKLEG